MKGLKDFINRIEQTEQIIIEDAREEVERCMNICRSLVEKDVNIEKQVTALYTALKAMKFCCVRLKFERAESYIQSMCDEIWEYKLKTEKLENKLKDRINMHQ